MTSTCSEPTVYRSGPGLGLPIQVLLVEDDPYAAAYTNAQVSQNEDGIFRVEWKSNVRNAVSRLAKPGIDVVLLDLGMPELGGYKTHLAIKSAAGKAVPVVILTGDDRTVSQDITKLQGAANYLIKHRTSSVQLRRALYEAVVPATISKGKMTPEQALRIQHELLPGSGSIPNGDPFLTYGMWVLPFTHDAKGLSVFLADRTIASGSDHRKAKEEATQKLGEARHGLIRPA